MKIKEEYLEKIEKLSEEDWRKIIKETEKETNFVFPILGCFYFFMVFLVLLLLSYNEKYLACIILGSLSATFFIIFILYIVFTYLKLQKLDIKNKAAFYLQTHWFKEEYIISRDSFSDEQETLENIGLCYKNRFLRMRGFYVALIFGVLFLIGFFTFLICSLEGWRFLIFFLPFTIVSGLILFFIYYKKNKKIHQEDLLSLGKDYLSFDRRVIGNNRKRFQRKKGIYLTFSIVFFLASIIFGSLYLQHSQIPNYGVMKDVSGTIENYEYKKNLTVTIVEDEKTYIVLEKYAMQMEQEDINNLPEAKVNLKISEMENDTAYVYFIKSSEKEILSEEKIRLGEKKEILSSMTLFYFSLSIFVFEAILWITDYFYTKVREKTEFLSIGEKK